MPAFTGINGIVKFAAATVHVTGWEATETNDLQPTTDTGSGGFVEEIPGNRQLTGSATFNIKRGSDFQLGTADADIAAAHYDGSYVAIQPAMQLYFQSSAGAFINLPVVNIANVRITSQQGGVVSGTFEFRSSGTYTIPSSFA